MKRSPWLFAILTLRACLPLMLAGDEVTNATPAPEPTPDKSTYTIFNPTPRKLWRAFNTDRPSKTDSPFTIDAGVFQMETDVVNYTNNPLEGTPGRSRVQTFLWGQTNFKLGLANWMDLQIFPQGYVEKRIGAIGNKPAVTLRGFGDTNVRIKFNVLGNDGGDLILALVPTIKIPTNTAGLGNKTFEPGLEFVYNYNLPKGFILFGQTRVDALRLDDRSGRRYVWSNPIGVFTPTFASKFTAYAEFYNAVSTQRGNPWVGTADVGLIYLVTPNFSIDVNAFFGLTRSADNLNVFTGFAYRF